MYDKGIGGREVEQEGREREGMDDKKAERTACLRPVRVGEFSMRASNTSSDSCRTYRRTRTKQTNKKTNK